MAIPLTGCPVSGDSSIVSDTCGRIALGRELVAPSAQLVALGSSLIPLLTTLVSSIGGSVAGVAGGISTTAGLVSNVAGPVTTTGSLVAPVGGQVAFPRRRKSSFNVVCRGWIWCFIVSHGVTTHASGLCTYDPLQENSSAGLGGAR